MAARIFKGTAIRHLLQHRECAGFEPDKANAPGPGACGLGTRVNLDAMASRGTNQTAFVSKAPGVFQGSQPTREPTRSQAYQQIERDLKDLNACVPGNLSLEGMRD